MDTTIVIQAQLATAGTLIPSIILPTHATHAILDTTGIIIATIGDNRNQP
ncbi:MAG: hypothetical protein GY753_01695 [Gammaproteobacteria bacterium]|nr:hypothetical protein [Gammaproteobacteria bacterium]